MLWLFGSMDIYVWGGGRGIYGAVRIGGGGGVEKIATEAAGVILVGVSSDFASFTTSFHNHTYRKSGESSVFSA